uniref:Uncharacterized protein n=1 Tax=Ciona intestinalis TaxID=7719 RepID=F6ZRE1_CIOIN
HRSTNPTHRLAKRCSLIVITGRARILAADGVTAVFRPRADVSCPSTFEFDGGKALPLVEGQLQGH